MRSLVKPITDSALWYNTPQKEVLIMPNKVKLLKPSDVPERARAALDFDSQKTERTAAGKRQLKINRTCLKCGEQRKLLVYSIRNSALFSGLCQKCAGEEKLKGVTGVDHPSWQGGVTLRNASIRSMKRMAEKRGYEWSISDEYATALMESPCFYCEKKPSNERSDPSYKGVSNTSYTYNGIDRINNNEGYTVNNTVPCCFVCNRSKGDMSVSQWLAHIKTILTNEEKINDLSG